MWQANVIKFHDKCTQETGADPKLTLRLMPFGEYVDDYKVKCYMRCIFDNWNVIYSDNSIHHKRFDDIMYMDDHKLKKLELPDKCYNMKLSDQCENAYRVSECIYRATEKLMNEDAEK